MTCELSHTNNRNYQCMKTFKILFFAIILLTNTGCAVWKNNLSPAGSLDVAINNVITDFVYTSKLFKADPVFDVVIIDNIDYYVISICGAVNKIYPQIHDTIGARNNLFPTKFFVKGGKLFYWNDPEQAITQNVLDILSEFNHIDFDWRDREYNIPLNVPDGDPRVIYLPPVSIDDGKLGVAYYMCKNNFTNYKKTGVNTIKKHYRVPRLKCNK